jgi:hypothetical protein
MPAMLMAIRKGAGIELRRGAFDIELDGRSVGSIIRGGDVQTPVDAGRHTIQIRTGRYSSRLDSLEVADVEIRQISHPRRDGLATLCRVAHQA